MESHWPLINKSSWILGNRNLLVADCKVDLPLPPSLRICAIAFMCLLIPGCAKNETSSVKTEIVSTNAYLTLTEAVSAIGTVRAWPDTLDGYGKSEWTNAIIVASRLQDSNEKLVVEALDKYILGNGGRFASVADETRVLIILRLMFILPTSGGDRRAFKGWLTDGGDVLPNGRVNASWPIDWNGECPLDS